MYSRIKSTRPSCYSSATYRIELIVTMAISRRYSFTIFQLCVFIYGFTHGTYTVKISQEKYGLC